MAIILIIVIAIVTVNIPKANEETKTAGQIIRQDVISTTGYTFNVKTEELKNKIMKIVQDADLQEQTIMNPETGEPIIDETTGEEFKYGIKEKQRKTKAGIYAVFRLKYSSN